MLTFSYSPPGGIEVFFDGSGRHRQVQSPIEPHMLV